MTELANEAHESDEPKEADQSKEPRDPSQSEEAEDGTEGDDGQEVKDVVAEEGPFVGCTPQSNEVIQRKEGQNPVIQYGPRPAGDANDAGKVKDGQANRDQGQAHDD